MSTMVNIYKSIGLKAPKTNVYGLELPFRLCIYAPSGTGKNILLMNLIDELQDDFDKVIFVTKTENEPIYSWIKEKLDPEYFEFVTDTPEPDELDDKTLLVLDDQILEKKKGSNKDNNNKMFIYGRKSGVNVVFLTQVYGGKDGLDQLIRKNLTGVIFKRPMESDVKVLKQNLDIDQSVIDESADNWILVNRSKSKKDESRVSILD